MKKIYFIVTVFLIITALGTVSGRQKVSSAPVFYGKSTIANHGSLAKISEARSIERPILVGSEDIVISAGSFTVTDMDTMSPLLEKNADTETFIASITKLMTALVVVENSKLNDIVEIKSSFGDVPSGKMGLGYGERISIESLLSGLLISSSNDAAVALADHIAKGNSQKFIDIMNAKAKEIGMNSTNFTNPIGLDSSQNYSTAQDLVYLANYSLKDNTIADLAQQKEKKVKTENGKSYELKATNELLSDKEVKVFGIKTGLTPVAGGCLLSLAEIKNGHRILTVVLGSSDRFGDTKKLIQWTEKNIDWK